ncbi:F-box protein GID2 [Camellia lanceoleosa]|uniref:F-box protein GID2 n=1 Tax=Camellia lanceoleosa TaxID=1840588 RepID=A0ACC0HI45_9ERIC|nr:F-box protein GID2 [Camellia lanceoleosa]
MKRPVDFDDDPAIGNEKKVKKIKPEEEPEAAEKPAIVLMDENLLYEVLKHVDAEDERLWELICTRHWANIGCSNQQLRAVVLALGGFRRLHSLYLWPLFKPSSSSSSSAASSSAWPCFPPPPPSVVPAKPTSGDPAKTCWGKDEVHLSLSLLSIRYYEKMNFNNRGKGL